MGNVLSRVDAAQDELAAELEHLRWTVQNLESLDHLEQHAELIDHASKTLQEVARVISNAAEWLQQKRLAASRAQFPTVTPTE